ncbi:MAG TPA: hypothetical protein GXX40_05080 [Firmicutes bacterium]|nr:hypothetical protein [Bacillota bacterium]
MGSSKLYETGCPKCGSKPMRWSGIRIPSLLKATAGDERECDYILRCPVCGEKKILAVLPEGGIAAGDDNLSKDASL